MEVKTNLSGFVLAGGKSSRMGTDKSLLVFQHEPLLQRMIRLIKPFCDQVYISGQNPEYSVFKVDLVPDLFIGYGPISGLYSSLKFSSTEWNLFVSVDVPFVNEVLLGELIAKTSDCACVIPQHEKGVEPLIALYHKSCLGVIEEMIHTADFKLMNLLPKLETHYLNCDSLLQIYPRLFLNLNQMDDFRSI